MSDLEIEIDDGVAVMTINRPHAHNTVGGTLLRDLLHAAEEFERNDSVRAVVTTANGPIWCASAAFDDIEGINGSSVDDLLHGKSFGGDFGLPVLSEQGRRFDRIGIGHWVLRFLGLQKPLIAAITGSAGGSGIALALLHDFRIAAEGARFRAAFLSVGVGPELGMSWTLPRTVGIGMATEMLLGNRGLNAAEALDCGLVHQVRPQEEVLSEALVMATKLAAMPPLAVRATVRALRAQAGNTLEEQLALEWDNQRITIPSDDVQRALQHIREARANGGAPIKH